MSPIFKALLTAVVAITSTDASSIKLLRGLASQQQQQQHQMKTKNQQQHPHRARHAMERQAETRWWQQQLAECAPSQEGLARLQR
mmetsp:Transcript_21561/g.31911  ORF Transcript_21561/g.31911 Transcript_21561/m.31911 type:complete len:85 (+) Transcript_21561:91-345(+)